MVVKFTRCLLAAALSLCASTASADITTGTIGRESVDVSSHPWSAIGKLFNEAGGACTGAIISRDKILTAAHCVYSERTRRFLPASSIHFMVGYRGGQAAVHARVAGYEVGAGYDPQRWVDTLDADWVILTLTEELPVEIVPLKLADAAGPSGTRAFIAGYPRDRAHRLTADLDCELGDGEGRMLFHTCTGTKGYSGAPILVSAGDNEVRIAGIHVAATRRDGTEKMLAVPAQAIVWEVNAPRDLDPKPMVFAALWDSGWFE